MLKPLVLALTLLPPFAQAYQVNDQVDAEVIKLLNIDNSKITLIDFFASWCTSCKKEIPELSEIVAQLDAEKVEIIGVGTDKDLQKGLDFQQKLKDVNGLKFRVFNDTDQAVVSKFKPYGMPALYYLQDGEIIKIRLGAIHKIGKKVLADVNKMAVTQ